ncbi:MAG: NAD(+) synthase [Victivallaceae bacterium]
MNPDFYRLVSVSPQLNLADPGFNADRVIEALEHCRRQGAALALFPELGISSYSCGDLFYRHELIESSRRMLLKITENTRDDRMVVIVGLPLAFRSRLYNVAAVIQAGQILGLVPKSFLPNYREFYEKRQFNSGRNLVGQAVEWPELSYPVPFGTDLIFSDGELFEFGVEICEDLWSPCPPCRELALRGARLIANLSATTAQAGKCQFRRELIAVESSKCAAVYLFASAGIGESGADAIFGSHLVVAANGRVEGELRSLEPDTHYLFADVDLRRLDIARRAESSYADCEAPDDYRRIAALTPPGSPDLRFVNISRAPFEEEVVDPMEVFDLQSAALGRRLAGLNCRNLTLGISGGLDSTLALLVAADCFAKRKFELTGIHAVGMPGFGTSKGTRSNAEALAQALGVPYTEIDIRDICRKELELLGRDESRRDVVYENVQARARTSILMNLANGCGGIVLGTGDLSEIALGWSTFNGDHMSMYSVNASVPKTLIRRIVAAYAASRGGEIAAILQRILDTPVSPELLPPDENGDCSQKTEDLLGPYELHDFFLYHLIRSGAGAAKLQSLAMHAFRDVYPSELIASSLKTFLKRFHSQQFKRNAMPDGPKVCSVSLSPRGDWRMPSDLTSIPPELS